MKISGNYFTYDGIQSVQYGLRILHIDTQEEIRTTGEVEYHTVFNRSSKKLQILDRNWTESPIAFETEIISEKPIGPLEASEIQNWLFNKPSFARFYVETTRANYTENIEGETRETYFECVFYNPSALLYADGLHGWKCQCLTSSSMAIQESVEKRITTFGENIIINVDTDLFDYIYPAIVLRTGSNRGSVDIVNKTDNNRLFRIEDLDALKTLYIDNEVGTIIDETGETSLYSKLAGQRFFRLRPGLNVLAFTGSLEEVTLKWNNARWFR